MPAAMPREALTFLGVPNIYQSITFVGILHPKQYFVRAHTSFLCSSQLPFLFHVVLQYRLVLVPFLGQAKFI